jgi:ribosomal protein S27AE
MAKTPEAAPVETTGSDEYVSRKKPTTVARCPGCSAWVFYRALKDPVKCGKCGNEFKPADAKRANVGDASG